MISRVQKKKEIHVNDEMVLRTVLFLLRSQGSAFSRAKALRSSHRAFS